MCKNCIFIVQLVHYPLYLAVVELKISRQWYVAHTYTSDEVVGEGSLCTISFRDKGTHQEEKGKKVREGSVP